MSAIGRRENAYTSLRTASKRVKRRMLELLRKKAEAKKQDDDEQHGAVQVS